MFCLQHIVEKSLLTFPPPYKIHPQKYKLLPASREHKMIVMSDIRKIYKLADKTGLILCLGKVESGEMTEHWILSFFTPFES